MLPWFIRTSGLRGSEEKILLPPWPSALLSTHFNFPADWTCRWCHSGLAKGFYKKKIPDCFCLSASAGWCVDEADASQYLSGGWKQRHELLCPSSGHHNQSQKIPVMPSEWAVQPKSKSRIVSRPRQSHPRYVRAETQARPWQAAEGFWRVL